VSINSIEQLDENTARGSYRPLVRNPQMTVAAVAAYRRYIAQYHLYTFSALRATSNYRPLVRKKWHDGDFPGGGGAGALRRGANVLHSYAHVRAKLNTAAAQWPP